MRVCMVFLLIDEINTCLDQKNRIYSTRACRQKSNLESREGMFRCKLTHVKKQLLTSRLGLCLSPCVVRHDTAQHALGGTI